MIINGKIDSYDLDRLNRKLADTYSYTNNIPNFRVIWADDLLEKRIMTHTDAGVQLLIPEVREVPKYWGLHIAHKYVLEGLKAVPVKGSDLPTVKISYEPIWVFRDKENNALYPRWEVAKLVLDNMQRNMQQAGLYVKYKDKGETDEEYRARIDRLTEEMFQDETDIGDALATKNAIIVP